MGEGLAGQNLPSALHARRRREPLKRKVDLSTPHRVLRHEPAATRRPTGTPDLRHPILHGPAWTVGLLNVSGGLLAEVA